MRNTKTKMLSEQGIAFLNDPILRTALSKIALAVGTTPEEYLLRFEKVLNENPNAILAIFENKTSQCF